MEKLLGFGVSRPFDLEEELANERERLSDDGSAELNEMLPCGVTREEAYVMRMEHQCRVAAAAQPRPRPKRKAAPPKTTAENGMLTVAGAAAKLNISADAALNLIRAGRLKAANVGRGKIKPRWRISREALDQLAKGREAPAPKTRTRRTKNGTE